MAGAIIPLIGSAVTTLGPLIPGIVQFVEGLLGPKSGSQKMAAATDLVKSAATSAVTAGTLPAVPDVSTIQTMIETVVQAAIKAGTLPGAANPKPPAQAPPVPTILPQPTATGPVTAATEAIPTPTGNGVKVTFVGVIYPQ